MSLGPGCLPTTSQAYHHYHLQRNRKYYKQCRGVCLWMCLVCGISLQCLLAQVVFPLPVRPIIIITCKGTESIISSVGVCVCGCVWCVVSPCNVSWPRLSSHYQSGLSSLSPAKGQKGCQIVLYAVWVCVHGGVSGCVVSPYIVSSLSWPRLFSYYQSGLST